MLPPADARPKWPQSKPNNEFAIPHGLERHEHFVQSLRENLPSRETTDEGHYAAGAADLGNLACRRGRRMGWDWAEDKLTEG